MPVLTIEPAMAVSRPQNLWYPVGEQPDGEHSGAGHDDARARLAEPAQPASPALRTAPILVVDDDPNMLEVIADILGDAGYTVETALNGAAALQVIEHLRPGLVLLDMRMPILDGWGFARELRERGVELPIVVMTAAQDARRWAQEIGAQGFLGKPFELVALLTAVDQWYSSPQPG